jgi:hypothetical protein
MEQKIAELQERIAAAFYKETNENIPALVAELNELTMLRDGVK